jgi:ApaG protein
LLFVSTALPFTAMYQQATENIFVTVRPIFLDDQSNHLTHEYVWAYCVRIENKGSRSVQLKRRYWSITDAVGRHQEVRGDGVVGEQPLLNPGQAYEYVSGTPLATPSGMMVGHYEMEADNGDILTVAIPAFSLDSPFEKNIIN